MSDCRPHYFIAMLKKRLLMMAILLMPLAFGGLAQNPFSINTDINTAGKTLKQVITEIENRYDVSFS